MLAAARPGLEHCALQHIVSVRTGPSAILAHGDFTRTEGRHASVSGLAHNAPEAFTLAIAGLMGGWLTVGRLTLLDPMSDTGDRLDPMLNSPPGCQMAPAWLRTVRELAYQGSRHGHAPPIPPGT